MAEQTEERTAAWIIGGQYFGSGNRTIRFMKATLMWPDGILFYCPSCGEPWGQYRVEGSKTYAMAMPCRKCPGHYGALPGSIWISWDADYQASMTREVLEREFLIHLAAFDRGELA